MRAGPGRAGPAHAMHQAAPGQPACSPVRPKGLLRTEPPPTHPPGPLALCLPPAKPSRWGSHYPLAPRAATSSRPHSPCSMSPRGSPSSRPPKKHPPRATGGPRPGPAVPKRRSTAEGSDIYCFSVRPCCVVSPLPFLVPSPARPAGCCSVEDDTPPPQEPPVCRRCR